MCRHGKGSFVNNEYFDIFTYIILQVVHDCRKMSDMLWHQYQVQMVNVFDTQVADLNVYQLRHRGDLPYYAKSLSVCLFEHLNLTTEQVFVYKIREESLKEDQSMWMLRPSSDVILDAAVKNVAFLLELRIALLERMLSRFVDGVDVYLSVIRDTSKQQYEIFVIFVHGYWTLSPAFYECAERQC
ncbi:piRNA biogenesis protein EXD1 [Lamellibrachia satsuma]|nr:piRNA biogenesis protein EXD1 [Lamellibrachia satsuma]